MNKIARVMEKMGHLAAEIDFGPLALILGVFYFITIPIWMPFYLFFKFIEFYQTT